MKQSLREAERSANNIIPQSRTVNGAKYGMSEADSSEMKPKDDNWMASEPKPRSTHCPPSVRPPVVGIPLSAAESDHIDLTYVSTNVKLMLGLGVSILIASNKSQLTNDLLLG